MSIDFEGDFSRIMLGVGTECGEFSETIRYTPAGESSVDILAVVDRRESRREEDNGRRYKTGEALVSCLASAITVSGVETAPTLDDTITINPDESNETTYNVASIEGPHGGAYTFNVERQEIDRTGADALRR